MTNSGSGTPHTAENPVSVVLIGAGGYGAVYLRALAERSGNGALRVAGIVDPYAEKSKERDLIREMGVAVHRDIEDFFAREKADLAIVSTPIHLHCAQTCFALSQGSHVLCEKPLTTVLQEARDTIAARDRSRRWVGVGFQWSYTRAIQALKNDIMSGALGRPLRLRTLVLWPRAQSYYKRNRWAGRKRDDEGRPVLDSPVSNAAAHFVHNAFYVLGKTRESSAMPVEIQAEVYRAYDIETFDTAAVRMRTEDGVEIVHLISHAVPRSRGPVLAYEFENGTVELSSYASDIVFRAKNGAEKSYGAPQSDENRKVDDAIEAARGGQPIACPPEAAYPHVVCVNGIEESMPEAVRFPESSVRAGAGRRPGSCQVWVEGLAETLEECFEKGKLPSELGAAWSAAGQTIDLRPHRLRAPAEGGVA